MQMDSPDRKSCSSRAAECNNQVSKRPRLVICTSSEFCKCSTESVVTPCLVDLVTHTEGQHLLRFFSPD